MGLAATKLDRTLLALADPTRRRVVELLRDEPRRAGELAAAVRMTPPAMSRHLKVLRKTGLVEEEGTEDDARVRVYRLRRPALAELGGWIREIESFWTDQLDAFKAYAERTRGPRSKKGKPS
jgi:DNA-binding transcriptional ArsR family regulator